MTIEIATPAQLYTVAGTGPYGTTWPYAEGAITASIVQADTTLLPLVPGTDFTVSPLSSDTAGNVTLSAGIAATHAGKQLFLQRVTPDEQGWVGNQSAREAGLETQLDQITMGLQEVRAGLGRALRTTAAMAAFAAGATGTTLMWDDGQIVPGPTAAAIIDAQANAEAAEVAAATAMAQAAILSGVQAYGALGNGSTNDQAAFDAALAATPGPVYVPWTTSNYQVTSLTPSQQQRLFGPGEIRIGATQVPINSAPYVGTDAAPIRVINPNWQPDQWHPTVNGSLFNGAIAIQLIRTGGFASYGALQVDVLVDSTNGQFDSGISSFVHGRNMTTNNIFGGWIGAGSARPDLGETYAGGFIVGLEVNAYTAVDIGLQADVGAAQASVGIQSVPDAVPRRAAPGRGPITTGTFAYVVSESVHGDRWRTGYLNSIDALAPGGIAQRLRGGSTLGMAPSHIILADGFYTNGAVFSGTFTDAMAVTGTGQRGLNLSAATIAGSAILLAGAQTISWGGATITGAAKGLVLSIGSGASAGAADDFTVYCNAFNNRLVWGRWNGSATQLGFHGVTPISRVTLPAAATDAATTQALANAIRTLLINYGLAA